MSKSTSNHMRIGPKSLGPNRGQRRQDWVLEDRFGQPLMHFDAILVFVSRRHAYRSENRRRNRGFRVAKLTKRHRTHAYKRRFA